MLPRTSSHGATGGGGGGMNGNGTHYGITPPVPSSPLPSPARIRANPHAPLSSLSPSSSVSSGVTAAVLGPMLPNAPSYPPITPSSSSSFAAAATVSLSSLAPNNEIMKRSSSDSVRGSNGSHIHHSNDGTSSLLVSHNMHDNDNGTNGNGNGNGNRFFFPATGGDGASVPLSSGLHTPPTGGSASNSPTPDYNHMHHHHNGHGHGASASPRVAQSTTSLPPLASPTAAIPTASNNALLSSFGVPPPRVTATATAVATLGSLDQPSPRGVANGTNGNGNNSSGYHYDAAGHAHLGGHLSVSTGMRTNAAGIPLSRVALSPTAVATATATSPNTSMMMMMMDVPSTNHGGNGSLGQAAPMSHMAPQMDARRKDSGITAPTLFSIISADGKQEVKSSIYDTTYMAPVPTGPPPRSWADESFSDWTVHIGNRTYQLHKMALGRGARRSDFFLRLFTTSMRSIETLTSSTDLTQALPRRCDDVWEAVLDFIYDGHFAPSTQNALPMLRLAQYLQIDTLQQKMHHFISQSLGRDTGLLYLLDGVELKQEEVLVESMITVARYFQTYPLHQLVSLPPDLFRAITSKEKINISSENDIFYAVKKYCESREGLTDAEIASLYSSCRYALMSADALLIATRTPGVPQSLLMSGMVARLLRQEKSSTEFEAYVRSQDEPWRLEQRAGVNRKFVYQHDGDVNGLLHWIGTQHDTQPWTNPNKLGLVGLSSSQVDRGQLTDLLEEKNSSFFLNPSSNAAWFAIDLGKYHIIPSHYTLRHSQVNPADHFIRNWKFQGSNDGIHWTTIMAHKRDTSIDVNRLTATFAVPADSPAAGQAFNKLKIMSTGQNSSNRGYFLVSGFEVYGTACNVPPLAKAIIGAAAAVAAAGGNTVVLGSLDELE